MSERASLPWIPYVRPADRLKRQERAIHLYREGLSGSEVGKRVHLTASAVCRIIRLKAPELRRKPGGPNRHKRNADGPA